MNKLKLNQIPSHYQYEFLDFFRNELKQSYQDATQGFDKEIYLDWLRNKEGL